MRAIVVRHYRTVSNECGQIMGWHDAPPAADWQSDLAYVDSMLRRRRIKLDGIHSSALARARRTALYYAHSRGHCVVHESNALNEVNYGDQLYRADKAKVALDWPLHKKDADFVYPGGESFRQMQTRCVGHLMRLSRRYTSESILLVVHSGVIRALVSYFLELPYTENLDRYVSHRFLGEFRFHRGECIRYEELGARSGFVRDGVINTPWHAPDTDVPMPSLVRYA